MSLITRYNRQISLVTLSLVFGTLTLTPAKAAYNPELGRFMQRDLRETAVTLTNVLLRNAQTQRVFAEVTSASQYTDGLNLYQYQRGSPLRTNDPTGEAVGDFDYSYEAYDILAQIIGERIVAAQERLFMLDPTARVAATIAFQTLLTVTVPGAGLCFAAQGLTASVNNIAVNGFTFWNTVGLVAGVAGGVGATAIAMRGISRLRGYMTRTRIGYVGAPNWYNRAVAASQNFRIPAARWKHIVKNHGPTSVVPNKSLFDAGTDIRSVIRRTIKNADEYVAIHPNMGHSVGGWKFDLDPHVTIGKTIGGVATSRVKIILSPNGNVVTAYPIP